MPYNGNGTFTQEVIFVDGTTATAEDQNAQGSDFAAGLTDCMTRDGQAPALANLSMGGFRLEGLGPAINPTDAVTLAQTNAIVPPGVILPYGGATAPLGFFLCFGQPISRSTFANLFTVLGTIYGAGDGTTTFNIPDLRGRPPVGPDNMGGTPANRITGFALADSQGSATQTLTVDQMPSHTHIDSGHTHAITDPGHFHSAPNVGQLIAGDAPSSDGSTASFTTLLTTSTITNITINSGTANNQDTGGGEAHNNIQPIIGINYIIKT